MCEMSEENSFNSSEDSDRVGKIILSLSMDVLGFRMLWHFVWWWALHHILCNAHQESRVVAWICQSCRLHLGYIHFTIVYCFIFRFLTFWSGLYLSTKEDSLFVLFVMFRSSETWCLFSQSWYGWKALD
jgi:hypothetical protein